MSRTTIQLLQHWNRKRKRRKKNLCRNTMPVCIWWTVGNKKNARYYEDKANPTQQFKSNCTLLFLFWCNEVFCKWSRINTQTLRIPTRLEKDSSFGLCTHVHISALAHCCCYYTIIFSKSKKEILKNKVFIGTWHWCLMMFGWIKIVGSPLGLGLHFQNCEAWQIIYLKLPKNVILSTEIKLLAMPTQSWQFLRVSW